MTKKLTDSEKFFRGVLSLREIASRLTLDDIAAVYVRQAGHVSARKRAVTAIRGLKAILDEVAEDFLARDETHNG